MIPIELGRELRRVILWHDRYSRKPGHRFRGAARGEFRTIPYGMHPIWAALTILHETDLPVELRWEGAQVLLYHDILENTTIPPRRIPRPIRQFVELMSFVSFDEEMELIWSREPKIRLFSLFEKVSNFMDGRWIYPKRRKLHREHLRKLADDVERNFGILNIIRIARVLMEGP